MFFFRSDHHCLSKEVTPISGTKLPENKLAKWAYTTVIRFEDLNLYLGSAYHHASVTPTHWATDTHFVLEPKTTLILTQE